jgi:hypothetical protein
MEGVATSASKQSRPLQHMTRKVVTTWNASTPLSKQLDTTYSHPTNSHGSAWRNGQTISFYPPYKQAAFCIILLSDPGPVAQEHRQNEK